MVESLSKSAINRCKTQPAVKGSWGNQVGAATSRAASKEPSTSNTYGAASASTSWTSCPDTESLGIPAPGTRLRQRWPLLCFNCRAHNNYHTCRYLKLIEVKYIVAEKGVSMKMYICMRLRDFGHFSIWSSRLEKEITVAINHQPAVQAVLIMNSPFIFFSFLSLKPLPVSFCFSENWWNAWYDAGDWELLPSADPHSTKEIHACITGETLWPGADGYSKRHQERLQ